MSDFSFSPAVREKTPMILALAGASGSGKTYSALELASGLAGDGKIAFIDTEGRRGLHYADQFKFDYCELRSPYEPASFLRAWKAAEAAGYTVIVTDSYSDEYIGEGGLVDMAAKEIERVKNSAAAWARPKAAHKLGVRWMRQARCHLIFCLRAEEKVRLEQADRGGKKETVVVPIGWQPVCEKNVPYEMTTSFMLTPDNPGVPQPIKLQEQHRKFFPTGQKIGRECGKRLAEWCAGGRDLAPPIASPSPPLGEAEWTNDLLRTGEETAQFGTTRLQEWWENDLTREERRALRNSLSRLQSMALEADAAS